jgi:uncharacterized protein
MADRVVLGFMARAASDDRGKTRLTRALGIDDGAGLRRAILLDTFAAIRSVRLADRILLFTPDDARGEFADLGAGITRAIHQRGETLSHRLEHGFADLFALGYDAAALIGSDLPTLPASHVEEGIQALMRHPDPLVLGPAEDGGYYFIGLRRPHPELFRGVPWSSAGVLAATLAIAAGEGLPVTLISSWYDVDTVPDLERALASRETSSPSSGAAHHLCAWAAAERRRPSPTWPRAGYRRQRQDDT